jgi:hypothetical protein
MAYTKYSLTPADNNAAPPNGAPEGMLPSAVNDTMRDMMAQIRDVGDGIRGGTYTMTAPIITGGTITGVALTGNTFTSPVISGGSINNTPIGATTASTGAFSTLSATGVTTVQAGTVSAPAITTSGDTNTGIFFPAADTIAFTEGGSEAMRIDSSGNVGIGMTPASTVILDVKEPDAGQDGIFRVFPGTGNGIQIRSIAQADSTTSAMSFYTVAGSSATERMRITSTGNVGIGTSSPAFPLDVQCDTNAFGLRLRGRSDDISVLRFVNNAANTILGQFDVRSTDFRINAVAAIPLVFYTTDTERMRIASGGNVGIATTTTTRARLNIDTDGSNNASGYGIALTNTAGGGATWTLQCGDQGVNNAAFTIRETGISGTTRLKLGTDGYLTVPGVYALTTGSAANVFVDSNGILQRSTSSLKYKKDIKNATHGLTEVLQLRPVTYKSKAEGDGNTVFGGLIAEEVDAIGLTEFVQYAKDGSPDSLAYGNMVSLLAKAIQELKAELDSVKAELQTLKGA